MDSNRGRMRLGGGHRELGRRRWDEAIQRHLKRILGRKSHVMTVLQIENAGTHRSSLSWRTCFAPRRQDWHKDPYKAGYLVLSQSESRYFTHMCTVTECSSLVPHHQQVNRAAAAWETE